MGQSVGSLRSHRIIRKDGRLVLEEQLPPQMLEFTPEHSHIISYGIDNQTSGRLKKLTPIAGYDAKSLSSVFQKTLGIPASNTKCCVASLTPGDCTFEGIHRSFMKAASQVDTNGIFVFCFTGHGIKVSRNGWCLAPLDFDYTENTFITAKVLTSWLQFVRFQGRYVLLVLDCCYAGGIAEQLVIDTVESDIPVPGLYVLTSCTAFESSLVVTTLEHSIFNYFLRKCLYESYYCQSGRLAIRELYQECETCCMALSSLLISYDEKTQLLKWSMMQPELKYYQLTEFVRSLLEESDEAVDAAPGRFEFVLNYYRHSKRGSRGQPVVIPDKCQAWLEIVSLPNGALSELHRRSLLADKLLSSAIAAMVYSMASFFIASNQPNVSSANVFLIAFIHVVAAIDKVHQNVTLKLEDLLLGLQYYHHVLEKHKIKVGKEIKSLYQSILRDIKRNTLIDHEMESTDSSETTDSVTATDASSDEDIEIPTLPEWVPAIWDD